MDLLKVFTFGVVMGQAIDRYVKRIVLANIERLNGNLKRMGIPSDHLQVSQVLSSPDAFGFVRDIVSTEILIDSGMRISKVASLNESARIYYANEELKKRPEISRCSETILKRLERLERSMKTINESKKSPELRSKNKDELIKKAGRETDESLFVLKWIERYEGKGKKELFECSGAGRAYLFLTYCCEKEACELVNKMKGKKNWIIKSKDFYRDKSWRAWIVIVDRGFKKWESYRHDKTR